MITLEVQGALRTDLQTRSLEHPYKCLDLHVQMLLFLDDKCTEGRGALIDAAMFAYLHTNGNPNSYYQPS